MSDAILLLSGGLDSYTAGAIAQADGFALNALTIRYGQVHAREIEADVIAICDAHVFVDDGAVDAAHHVRERRWLAAAGAARRQEQRRLRQAHRGSGSSGAGRHADD